MTAREVELSGGAPWGFRMHGGADLNQPLRISRSLSDTPYRTFNVNPGRKASLCGIREGDVISSINGRPTRSMSNVDAHAMLRSAGPVLRLGLNEDREMSPRRRSIGKGSELKRPSQLIAEGHSGRATPQAPVYATIRPSQSPQNRPSPSIRSSLNSLPAALNSTPLVRSVANSEEPPRFHPTNPFYTTLPSNYSSASKLPVPNGRPSFSTLDRNKPKDSPFSDYSSDLKSPSFFTKTLDSGSSSLPYSPYNGTDNTNGYSVAKSSDKNDYSFGRKFDQFNNQSLPNDDKMKNPFDTKRNSDPFEKYLRSENNINGTFDHDIKTMPSSMSDSNFRSKEETTKCSTITEHKISEVEEVKTIKKIIFNGREDSSEGSNDARLKSPENSGKAKDFTSHETKEFYSSQQSPRKESTPITPTQQRNEPFSTSFDQKEREQRNFGSSTTSRQSKKGYIGQYSAETPSEVVTVKPPLKSPSTPTPVIQSTTQKRECIHTGTYN